MSNKIEVSQQDIMNTTVVKIESIGTQCSPIHEQSCYNHEPSSTSTNIFKKTSDLNIDSNYISLCKFDCQPFIHT